tara:strand:+ start:3812 stop:4030 length:219 start_codon:yes stop_codon:yes gene_type:complete
MTTKMKYKSETISPWENDDIQFARLLDEIQGNVTISDSDMEALCESMNLSKDEIFEIFERAQSKWDKIKESI